MSDIYEKKNRKDKPLPILEIRVTAEDGTIVVDPNGAAIMAHTGNYPKAGPVPGLVSEISGKPAYKIETDDLELHLSFEEMDRFFRHDLTSKEYKFLLNKYGMFHEIHEDFYWKDEAFQPMDIARKTVLRIQSEKEGNPTISADVIKKIRKSPKTK
jgi:hypothetical protein